MFEMKGKNITDEVFNRDYKGKTIIGFQFSRREPCGYNKIMNDYIGLEGTIVGMNKTGLYEAFDVMFEDGESWLYPMKDCLEQLEDNNKSETELFGDIYNLLKSI